MRGARLGVHVRFAALGLVAALADPSQSESNNRPFTTEFALDRCTFVTGDDPLSPGNPLFPLIPGQQRILEGEDADGELCLQITTCRDDGSNCSTNDGSAVPGTYTVEALGIDTRVIEEREYEDGELIEISHNYFARCEKNNAIVYFGEGVEDIEDGVVVGAGGAWEAGVDEARPGVVMPGLFLLGARYFQEIAPGVAMDRGENAAMDLEIDLDLMGDGPVVLEGCVLVVETSELSSSDRSSKVYCPGVGLVIDDAAELTGKNF